MTMHSRASSPTSPPARIEWRPSRLLAGLLVALGTAAAAAPWFAQVPTAAAAALSVAVAAGVCLQVRREARRPRRLLVWAAGEGHALLLERGVEVRCEVVEVRFRGRLAVVALRRDARIERLVWWPDTLDAAQRRALRIAAAARPPEPSVLPLIGG
ncbi:hypothetical protein [Coralloluteibacterium thermophilus]|uniref:Uncharacterized protein n=1 Tax=Coralloluteibacterium thermophilum TaxID=2707049 RepID=A0ABV9NIB1_9GAMM